MGLMEHNSDLDKIYRLLKKSTSISLISDFLKSKKLTHSASSWDKLFEKRLTPAVQSEKLSIPELINLLNDCEEHGQQHVFLYSCSAQRAADIIEKSRITKELEKLELSDLLSNPKIVENPEKQEITDVRWSNNNGDDALIIKITERRLITEYVGETTVNNKTTKTYVDVPERVVNTIILRKNGTLELRIQSHRNSSKYTLDRDSLLKCISPLIPTEHFNTISLSKAKQNLWDNRKSLYDKIKYSHSTLRNDQGTTLKAACGSEDYGLTDDTGASSSIDAFMKHRAFCDASNIYFIKQENGLPSKNIHMLLSGEMNEFAITQHCSKQDYEHVFNELKLLNR